MLIGTTNFSVKEALNASGGSIPADLQDNAQLTLECLQEIRDYIGRPIIITNLYRTLSHNAQIAGAAANSEHLRALGADFDVVGMTNHEAVREILAGLAAGLIRPFHQIITYTTDHHVHLGVAAESWPADEQQLLETAVGQYTPLTDDLLAQLTAANPVETAKQVVGQAVDAVQHTDVGRTAALVVLFLIGVPAVVKAFA